MRPTAQAQVGPQELLHRLDEAPISRNHWWTVLTTGLGFFTDAYDLFVIGTVTTLLQPVWHLSAWQMGLVNSTSLLSAAMGALVFGFLMDRLGRRSIYGIEAILLIIGALASAAAPSFTWLLASRFVLGLGVGGDYPASAVIMSEFAGRVHRGRLVSYVFTMQGLGLVAGPIATLVGLKLHLPVDTLWRVLLGLGALPALAAVYFRRTMPETPRFTLHVREDSTTTAAIVQSMIGQPVSVASSSQAFHASSKPTLLHAPFLKRLVATTICWFFIDIVFYGLGISSHLILNTIFPGAGLGTTTLMSMIIFGVTALPGYLVAARTMDTLGRRAIQWRGFGIIAVIYAVIGLFGGVLHQPWTLLVLYGVGYFFIEFGPNTTTFVYPSEVYPTHLRGRGHGIAAAGGKLGAFLSALLLPLLLASSGPRVVFLLLGLVAALGVGVTIPFLPEPKRRALEELNSFLQSDSVHHTYTRIIQSLHEDRLEDAIAAELLSISGSELVTLHLLDEKRMILDTKSWEGQGPEWERAVKRLKIPLTRNHEGGLATPIEHPLPNAFIRQRIMVNNDLNDPGTGANMFHTLFPSLRSVAAFPLLYQSRTLGVIAIWDRDPWTFSDERVTKLELFVQVAAMALARARQYTDMRYLAFTDGLTKLPNRMGLERDFERRCTRISDGQGPSFAFVVLDLDHFKEHNDHFGHQSGDAALQRVAEALLEAIGLQDSVARIGGDEFIILLDRAGTGADAVDRLTDLIAQLPLPALGLGISAGVALYPAEGSSYQDLYRVADRRLYAAKQTGRGRIVLEG